MWICIFTFVSKRRIFFSNPIKMAEWPESKQTVLAIFVRSCNDLQYNMVAAGQPGQFASRSAI